MKEWIRNKLGIKNPAKEHMSYSREWAKMGELISEGLQKGLGISDEPQMKCPYCQGTGETSFGPGIHENHRCGHCKGSGFDELSREPRMFEQKREQMNRPIHEQAKEIADVSGLNMQEVLDTMENMTIILGTDQRSAMEMIRAGLHKGMDKVDTQENVRTVRDDHTIIKPMINSFTKTVWDQQRKVLASGKYEHPIHKDNFSAMEWIEHQGQEFADAMVYAECLKQTVQDVVYLIEQAQMFNEVDRMDKSDIVNAILNDALDRLRKG